MAASPTNLSNIPSLLNPEGQVILRGRLKTSKQLTGAFQTFWWADRGSSAMRTMYQQQRDGAPPYDPARDRLLGLGGRANINFGEVNQLSVAANQPYNSLLDGIDYLCTMPTDHGNENDRMYWEEVMQDEFTRIMRSWDQFVPLWQINNRLFVDEGVSFVHFSDDLNWQYDVKGLQDFVFPRRTRASVEYLGEIYYHDYLMPSKLYEHCRDKDAARAEGWNPGACFEAIRQAAQQHSISPNDFQEWEKAWKGNDMYLGDTDITIEVIGGLIKEVDGTVSQYLARADGEGDFLYKSEGKYRSMSRVVVAYLNGVGTNNYFHSIRGMLAMVAPAAAGRNRALCRFLDRIWHDSTMFIQCKTEDDLTELPLMPMGQYAVVKPGFSFVETKSADFASGLLPAMQFLGQIMASNSSSYAPNQPDDQSSQPRTKYEKQMEYAKEGKISTGSMDLFKDGFQRHMREVVRRFIRKTYSSNEPGGWHVTEFRARCMRRGVPEEAIYKIDVNRIEVNMGIGSGSAVERKNIADQLYQTIFPNLDAEGKNKLLNMLTAAHAGVRVAKMLVPLIPGLRPPQDTENAQLENFVITHGGQIEVLLNQEHEVHLGIHLPEADRLMQANREQQISLQEMVPQVSALYQHCQVHMELLSPTSSMRGTFEEQMSQLNQAVTNGAKQLAAEQMKMMKEAQHNNGMVGGESLGQAEQQQGAQDLQANVSTLVQQVESHDASMAARQAMQHGEETHQVKMAMDRNKMENMQREADLKAAKTQQDMILNDAKTAASIRK